MPTEFDGDNLIVTLPEPTNGVLNLSWREDVYEAWKDWLLDVNENMKYVKLFDTFGGDELVENQLNAGAYFIVRNDSGWRFRPFEVDHTVYAIDNLTPKNSNIPIMIPTIGGYTVLIDGIRPNTEVVTAPSGPADNAQAMMDFIMENGETFLQAMRLIRAEAAGTIEVVANNQKILSADGGKTRIEANADSAGRDVVATDSS